MAVMSVLGAAVPLHCRDFAVSKAGAYARVSLAPQEFAEFAYARDVSEGVQGRTPLELPYAIDGDRVGSLTIKLMFNKVRRSEYLMHHGVQKGAG